MTALIPAAAAAGYSEPWRAALATTLLASIALLLVRDRSPSRSRRGRSPDPHSRHRGGIGIFIRVPRAEVGRDRGSQPGDPRGFTAHPLSPDILVAGQGSCDRRPCRGFAAPCWPGSPWRFALGWAARSLVPHLPNAISENAMVQAVPRCPHWHPDSHPRPAPSPSPLLLGLDWSALLDRRLWGGALVLFLMILFDATGTLLAVTGSSQGTAVPPKRRAGPATPIHASAAPSSPTPWARSRRHFNRDQFRRGLRWKRGRRPDRAPARPRCHGHGNTVPCWRCSSRPW